MRKIPLKTLILCFLPIVLAILTTESFKSQASTGNTAEKTESKRFQITELEDQTVRIDQVIYDYSETEISIPEELSGKRVTALGEDALYLEAIIDKEKSKGGNAFAKQNAIEKISLPSSLEVIEGNPFSKCTVLSDIVIGKENTHFTFEDRLLINEDSHTVITCVRNTSDPVEVPEGVLHIGREAFFGSGISDVQLPETLETIGDRAFALCLELHQIIIPESVQMIGEDAFYLTGNPMPGSYALLKQGIEIDYPFTIYASEGSMAAGYAKEMSYPLVLK